MSDGDRTRTLSVSFSEAPATTSMKWEPATVSWMEYIDDLQVFSPADTKDCGGVFGGTLSGPEKRNENVLSRSVVYLDADKADENFLEDLSRVLGSFRHVWHTTWSHTPEKPRYRVHLPLSRDVSGPEASLITRALMRAIGDEHFDPSCAEQARMMYLAAAQNGGFDGGLVEGEMLPVDDWLARAAAMRLDEKDGEDRRAGSAGLLAADRDPTRQEQEKANAIFDKAIREVRNAAETHGGRNNALMRWLPVLYQLSLAGCLDRDEVDAEMWTAAREADGPDPWTEEEHAHVSRNAAEYAEERGPGLPSVTTALDDFGGGSGGSGSGGGGGGRARPGLDVTNPAEVLDWCFRVLGADGTPLAGLFRRGPDIVFTPRVGEEGYIHPRNDRDFDGPAQIQRMNPNSLSCYLDRHYECYKMSGAGRKRASMPQLFPDVVAKRVVGAVELFDGLRGLQAVSHTPFVRSSGTVRREPGYDAESRTLYLPDGGLVVPEVGLDEALGLLLEELLGDFPFENEHHRANYIGALLTPLLRRLTPGPYPLFAFTAPQPGSGKSLLAQVLRILHGGVFRAEMVRDREEQRKQITTILDSTSAPVVTFDNMAGVLKSPLLDALLTSPEWSDRVLGTQESRTYVNDRLWTITGNNLMMGGDLKRRTVWVSIDPNTPHPENRTGFRHNNLVGWVTRNRGRLLGALLALVESWVDAGRPLVELRRTDSYGEWERVIGSILWHAGVPGSFNDPTTDRQGGTEDDEEWTTFVAAVERVFGRETWMVRDIFDATGDFREDDSERIHFEELPEAALSAYLKSPVSGARELGKWMQARAGRWTDNGRAVREVGLQKGSRKWRILIAGEELL